MNRRENRKHMAEERPDVEAIRRFRTPAYEAAKLIRAQGEQIGEDIRGDADGGTERID